MSHSKDKRQSYSSTTSIDEVQEQLANLADMSILSCITQVNNDASEVNAIPPTANLYTANSRSPFPSTPHSREQSKESVNENETRDPPTSEASSITRPAPSSIAEVNPIKPEIKIKMELAPLTNWTESAPFTFETLQTPHSPPEVPTSTFADALKCALLKVSGAHTCNRNMERRRSRSRARGRSGTRRNEKSLGANEAKLRHEARGRSLISRCQACYAIREGSKDHLLFYPARSPDYPSPFRIEFYERTEAKAAPLGLYKQLPSLPVGYYVNSNQDSHNTPTN